jgi:hypothetical protein
MNPPEALQQNRHLSCRNLQLWSFRMETEPIQEQLPVSVPDT